MSPRAAIYTRISDDSEGLGLGVERQRKDCQSLADRLGWAVSEVFVDNDTSNFTRKSRPAYERMLAQLEDGRLDALVVWDTDRLTRHPIELETIISLSEHHGVALASVGGEIDLGTPQGRLTARIKASVSRHEVEQSSRRIRRKTQERAEAGKPHGRTAYGWERVDGKDILVLEQAALLREMTDRVIAGESIRSIMLDLQRRGVPTPNGLAKWHPVMVRQLILRERNAGLRIHQKKVIGKGDWEPIVSVETFERAAAILRNPDRRTSPTSRHRHLLSGVARCGLCDALLRIMVANGTRPRAYVCQECFGIRRKQEAVDKLIVDLVCARLAMPDAVTVFTPDDQDAKVLLDEAGTLRARLNIVADSFANDEIDAEQLRRITAKYRPRLAEVELLLRSSRALPDLADLAAPDIASRWAHLPIERQRAVIDCLMTVRVLPIGKNGRAAFDPRGVSVEWKAPASGAVARA
jgi:site-specific DNA recombinase